MAVIIVWFYHLLLLVFLHPELAPSQCKAIPRSSVSFFSLSMLKNKHCVQPSLFGAGGIFWLLSNSNDERTIRNYITLPSLILLGRRREYVFPWYEHLCLGSSQRIDSIVEYAGVSTPIYVERRVSLKSANSSMPNLSYYSLLVLLFWWWYLFSKCSAISLIYSAVQLLLPFFFLFPLSR